VWVERKAGRQRSSDRKHDAMIQQLQMA